MRKERMIQNTTMLILAFAVLLLGVGFATFSQNLNIDGNVTVEASKWDIHLDETSYKLSEGSKTPTESPSIADTSMSYSVSLEKPTDYYEFTIDAVNNGTYNANLTSITLYELTEEEAKYIDYTVTYDGVDYKNTTDNLSLPINNTNGKKTIKVRVEYKDIEASLLPQTKININLTASFNYRQA